MSRQAGPEACLAVGRDHDGNLNLLRMHHGIGFAWDLTIPDADAVIAHVESAHRYRRGGLAAFLEADAIRA
jgi:hypothetical protein